MNATRKPKLSLAPFLVLNGALLPVLDDVQQAVDR